MIVIRRQPDSKKGTHGFMDPGGKLWHSIEAPDLGNKPFVSCIPCGEYVLVPYSSSRYGECFMMVNPDLNVYARKDSPGRGETGRYKCLFVHAGNEVENFIGCVGASHAYDVENDRLLSSTKKACLEINRLVHEEGSYRLLITKDYI